MTRRQREGRGGKDYHGCGNPRCSVCSPGRDLLGPTRQEVASAEDLSDLDRSIEGWIQFERMLDDVRPSE